MKNGAVTGGEARRRRAGRPAGSAGGARRSRAEGRGRRRARRCTWERPATRWRWRGSKDHPVTKGRPASAKVFLQERTYASNVPAESDALMRVNCPTGSQAIGGGGEVDGGFTPFISKPVPTGQGTAPLGWEISFYNPHTYYGRLEWRHLGDLRGELMGLFGKSGSRRPGY